MPKFKATAYIRLSYTDDRSSESDSVSNQRKLIENFAERNPDIEIVSEKINDGYSGIIFDRPAFKEMMQDVTDGNINCVIVKDFSRFGRNSIETPYFLERVFPLFHIRFISLGNDYDSDKYKGDTGGMDVTFQYLISEYYSRDMSMKTKSAKYAKMQRGEYQSKICPYGYRKSDDGRMEPDPEAASVVQLIFHLAADGVNATSIAQELYARGITTPGEYKTARGNYTHDISRSRGIWSNSTVLRILEDERYAGTYAIGKRAVIEVGGTRSKVFCGCCHHSLSRIAQKTPFFMCRHSQAGPSSRCHSLRVNAAELEQAVFQTLKKQL